MNAFNDAIAAILDDENFGVAAVYRVGGSGDGVEINVLRSMPDVRMEWAGAAVAAGAVVFRLLVADIPDPVAGDTITIGDDVYRVVDTSAMKDSLRITQTVVARRL